MSVEPIDPEAAGVELRTLRRQLAELRSSTTPHIHRRTEVATGWEAVTRSLDLLDHLTAYAAGEREAMLAEDARQAEAARRRGGG